MGVGSGVNHPHFDEASVCGRTIHSSQQLPQERFESPEMSVDFVIIWNIIRKVSEV